MPSQMQSQFRFVFDNLNGDLLHIRGLLAPANFPLDVMARQKKF